MQNHDAPISWFTPNRSGAQYSSCLLCRVIHIGRISQSEGNAPILMLQDFPEAMFAHAPGSVGQTPAELAHTHIVCVQGQGQAPNLQHTRIAGIYRLPPPTSLPENMLSTASAVGTRAPTAAPLRNVGSPSPPPALSLAVPEHSQHASRRGSRAPDTPSTPTGFGYSSGDDSPASETDASSLNSPRTPLSAKEYGMIASALMQRAGSAAPTSAPLQRPQQSQQSQQSQAFQREATPALSPSRAVNPAQNPGSPTVQKRHEKQQENAAASSSKAPQQREVIDVDADEDEQERESFGVPYVLLGLPDPTQPPPLTLTERLERARLELEENQRARRSPELAQRAVQLWVPALRRFLDVVQRCAPEARPGPADIKACVGALVDVLAELEARKNALSYEALLKTGLYNTVKELADANRNTEKLPVSDRARALIEHWNVYLPGIRVLAKGF